MGLPPATQVREASGRRATPATLGQSAVIVALLTTVFVSDTITDLEIAAAVFYVVPILLSVRILAKRHVATLAGLCVMLTIVSSVLTKTGSREAGIINLAISVAAIAVTTYLALRMIASETAFHEARAQLIRVSRISTLGELTASIAHEVNQPLAAVVASAGACRRWLEAIPPNVDKARESTERIVEGANLASAVITRVRRLSQQTRTQREWLDINELVAECIALASAEIDRSGTNLLFSPGDRIPKAYLDKIQIQQVLSNLILNAIEALAVTDRAEGRIEITTRPDDNDGVVIVVADNGAGFPDMPRERLFEPFCTTKDGGTGLGLTISRTIVETHGGQIKTSDTPGGGAIVSVTFPGAKKQSS